MHGLGRGPAEKMSEGHGKRFRGHHLLQGPRTTHVYKQVGGNLQTNKRASKQISRRTSKRRENTRLWILYILPPSVHLPA